MKMCVWFRDGMIEGGGKLSRPGSTGSTMTAKQALLHSAIRM